MSRKAVLGIVVLVGAGFAFALLNRDSTTNDPPKTLPSDSSVESFSEPQQDHADSYEAFDGDPCTEDCSGHEAGYSWAERRSITDEDECDQAGETSNSPSFAAGCKAYVRGDDEDESTDDDDDSDSQ